MLTIAVLSVKIGTPIFKINTPLPHPAFTNYSFSVHILRNQR